MSETSPRSRPRGCHLALARSEYHTTKYMTDVLLEAPFTEGNPDDMLMGVGEVSDIYDWVDNVMWPALFKRLPGPKRIHHVHQNEHRAP